MTASLLGVDDRGNPDPTAAPPVDLPTGPSFEDRWFDVHSQTMVGR